MPKTKGKSTNIYNSPIEVLSDEDDNENIIRNEQHNGDIRPLLNKEKNHTSDSTFTRSSPTTEHLSTDASKMIKNPNEEGTPTYQHLIDQLIQYPAPLEDDDPSAQHKNINQDLNHQHDGSMVISQQNDNDIDNDILNNDNDNINDKGNSNDEGLTFQPMPAFERSYRAHILRPINAISKQQNQVTGERNTEIILGDVRRRLNPVFRALYNSAWKHYSPLSCSSNDNIDRSCERGVNIPPLVSPTAWNIPGIPPLNSNDMDDEPFVLADQPRAVFADAAAEALTKAKLLPQTIRSLLKLGNILKDKSFLVGSSEDVVACIILDFMGMMCAMLRLGNFFESHDGASVNDDDSVEVVDKKIKLPNGVKEEGLRLSGNEKALDGIEMHNGLDKSNNILVPNLLEYIGNSLLSVTARVLTQEACHSGYTQSLFLMRNKNGGSVSVDETVHNITPAFYRTHLFDSERDRVEMDEQGTEYLSPLRSGEWRDYYALYHPESDNKMPTPPSACPVLNDEGDRMLEYQVSRHVIAVTRYFVQEKGLESLVHLVSSGIARDCDTQLDKRADERISPPQRRTRKQARNDRSRRMERASVGSVFPTLEIFRSVAFLSRFYCSNGSENNGGNIDCLSAPCLRGTLEAFRYTISQYIESLAVGVHIITVEDRQNTLNILSSIETRSMTEEEWQKTSNVSTISASKTEMDKALNTLPSTVRIVPFVDFTFSESSKMKMTMLWKFLTGHRKHRDMVATIVPSLQCQIQGLNELISWLNSLENDVQGYKAQHTIHSENELEKKISDTCTTHTKNDIVRNIESKRGDEDEKSNGMEDIEVEVVEFSVDGRHASEVSRRSEACDFTEPLREDDMESTEVCCNSNTSETSGDHLSSLSIEGYGGVSWPKTSGSPTKYDEKKEHEGTSLNEETKLQSWHRQDISASKNSCPQVNAPRNDSSSYKIFDLLQQRLLSILSQLRSSEYPILEHLFSPNGLHSELLKRTLPLLIFFSRHRKLRKNDIKLMWEASRFGSCSEENGGVEINDNEGKKSGCVQLHESVTSAIFDLILGLVNTSDSWILLGMDIFSYLANLFSQVRDCNWWTTQSLTIVESVIHHSIDAIIGNTLLGNTVDECIVPAGMDVLWSLSQDSPASGANTQRREITDTAFPMLMRVVERILTSVRDEFALYSKRIENSKVEHANGINGFVYKVPPDSLTRASNNTAIAQTRLAMQRLQTQLIRRSMTAIDVTDGSSCPTSTIRIMLCMMNFIPLQVETAPSEKIRAENSLLLSTKDILEYYDLGAMLIKEMIHFADTTRANVLPKVQCEHTLFDDSQYDGRFYSHSECVNFRLKLFRLTFTRCVQLHFLALQNMTMINTVIPVDDAPTKNKTLVEEQRNDGNDSTSKSPILSTEEYEMNGETYCNSPINSAMIEKRYQTSLQNTFLDLNTLHPTPVEISKIWSSLISNGLTEKTVEHTFDLLYCLLSQDFGHHSTELNQWKEELVRTIYPLCCKLYPPSINKAGYKLLIYCLGFMNVADGNFVLNTVTQERLCELDKRELSNILLGLSYGQESKQIYTPCCLFRASEPYALDIRSYQLCGLSTLWSIILEGRDDSVADMCMVYMAVLNAYASRDSDQQISFVQQCMEKLNEKVSGNFNLMKKKRMLRLIRLYTEYTMRSSCPKECPRSDISHGHHAAQVTSELHNEEIVATLPYDIYIDFLDGPYFKVHCPSGTNTTVAYVRKSIWHYFSAEAHLIKDQLPANGSDTSSNNRMLTRNESSLRLTFNGSELRDDTLKIGTLRIFENSTVYCCARMCSENIKKKAAHVVENSRKKEYREKNNSSGLNFDNRDNMQRLITPGIATLISPSCIDSFFSLFSPEVCDDPEDRKHLCALVWDLLQLLPTEPQLHKGFQSVGTHHQASCSPLSWEKWLPTPGEGQSASDFRLLYGLQLIEAFVIHNEGGKEDVTVHNRSPKSLNSLEKDSVTSSDDDVIIVKELKCESKTSSSKCIQNLDDQNITKKRAYVVMDDDDDDDDNEDASSGKRYLNTVEANEDGKHTRNAIKDHSGGARQWCKNFIELGGLQHLLHLFTSIDLSLLSTEDSTQKMSDVKAPRLCNSFKIWSKSQRGVAISCLPTLMACVNKTLFLMRIISTRATEDNGRNFMIEYLGKNQEIKSRDASQFLHHLFKMVHWAVEFQNFYQQDDEGCNLGGSFLDSKHLSSIELGASVATQCLFLVKMLSQTTKTASDQVLQQNLVLDYCIIDPNIDRDLNFASLSDAIVSSIVKSPALHVRSLGLSVFRSLLCVRQLETKCTTAAAKNTEKSDHRIKSFALSLLISLLPIGRGIDSEGKTNFEIISRTSAIFDMVSSCIYDIWLHSGTEMKQDAVFRFIEYFQGNQFVIIHEDSLKCSTAPTITGVQQFGLLFAWLIKEVNSLNPREFKTFSAVGDFYGKHCDLPCKVMVDSYLVGLLTLMHAIINIIDNSKAKSLIGNMKVSETKVFIQLLFEKCAFLKPQGKEPTSFFVSSQARDGSLELLRALCTDCHPNLVLLLTRIHDQFYSGPARKDLIHDWNVDLTLKQKSVTGHVGMKNQGATCYLNSLLQQFFHTPALREGLLSCDLNNSADDSSTEGYKLLYELQLLFGNLLLSEKKDFDTSELVKSIRGYDGNPIRPGEQQDVDEFFNLFCDRLETALKPFPQRRLLQNVFGGRLSHLITCQQCNYSSERVEDFLSISLDVKGKKHIIESLDLYIQGEVLDGSNKYFCSSCKAKRESIKRCCIKTLPNVLICHLKRFEFDLETLRKVKVNDRCEFPLQLNMKKYTKECMDCTSDEKESISWRTDNYYSYNLRGVLVHTGTADSGHYYSLAQVRQKETAHQEGNKNQWFCFNDSTVTPFDATTLEATTFGGSMLSESSNSRPEERGKIDLAKSYSAYLLIYDRNDNYTFDDQVKCKSSADSGMSPEKECNLVTLSLKKHGWSERIINENNVYIRDQSLFAPAYSYFLISLTEISMALNENEKQDTLLKLKAVQLLTCHWLENLVHAKERSNEIDKIVSILSAWYETNLEACSWFLEKLLTTHQIWVDKLLLHCYVLETRSSFAKMLSVIFLRMAPSERTAYYSEIDTSVMENSNCESTCDFDSDDYMIVRRRDSVHGKESVSRLGRTKYWKSGSLLARFVGLCLLDKLEGCDVHWRRFDQLFESILAFSLCGHEEACFLIRCGTILRLVDIYLENNSTVPQKSLVRSPFLQHHHKSHDRKIQMGDKYKKPNFFPLLNLLCNLVCSAMVVPDDDNISDSDASDTDSEADRGPISFNGIDDLETSYLTAFAYQAFDKAKMSYELPQRDGWQVSRPDLFEKMLDEPVINTHLQDPLALSCASSIGKRSRTASSESQNDVMNLICKITCHVCCDNFELSLRVCSFAKTLLEERKADEFNYALSVLLSMFHIKDKHFRERIPCALTAICTGIEKNSAYEKETVHLLTVLKNELGSRETSDGLTEGQAIFHENILKQLNEIILPLISSENATFAVKQNVVSLIHGLLSSFRDSLVSRIGQHQKYSSNALDNSQPHLKRLKAHHGQGENSESSHVAAAKPDSDRNTNIRNVKAGNILFKHHLDEEEIKEQIFSMLKRIFDNICETVATQSSRTARAKNGGITMQGRNRLSNGFEGFIVYSAAFFEYFEALRICLSGVKVQRQLCCDNDWIFEVSGVLFRLLWKIDDEGRMEKRPSADTTKGEIILLIEFILELNPSQCLRALQSDNVNSIHPSSLKCTKDTNNIVHDSRIINADPTTKMLEMYVTNSPNNADYNDKYMAHYYNVLLLLAGHSTDFRHAMISHDNWRWALKSFVLGHATSDSGKIHSVILNGTIKYVRENVRFREAIFRQLMKLDGKELLLSIDQERIEIGSIQLLFAIFDSESNSLSSIEENSKTVNTDCISHFVQGSCGGMSKLSLVFKKSITKLQEADSRQMPPGITVLKSLSLCLQCMCLTLSSFGIKKVREIMQDCWPEVDDVNFMLTQISTRTDNEWEHSYKISSEAKLIVMQIITQASEVLTILASVEAAVEAVAE